MDVGCVEFAVPGDTLEEKLRTLEISVEPLGQTKTTFLPGAFEILRLI